MYRIGFGTDLHRLEAGNSLILGGVEIDSDITAIGHSDADVLLHAVTDAILGAIAAGDIGSHFSDKDDRWKGAESTAFLHEARRLMIEKGYQVENVDSIINLESPKIGPYIDLIRARLAADLLIDIDAVSVKAKTGEGLGNIGMRHSIKAEACVLLKKA